MSAIKEFLKRNPLISVSGLEKQLSIPSGTVRVNSNKRIPKKYVMPIIVALCPYGFTSNNYLVEGIYTIVSETGERYTFYTPAMIPVIELDKE